MKINIEDIKVGYQFKSFDEDDQKWYKSEIIEININDVATLKDIDPNSPWQGMEWKALIEELQDITQYKAL